MNRYDRPTRLVADLPDILTEIASPRVPDYANDLLAQTAATRQRPRWSFIERWLPMNVLAKPTVPFRPVPWRAILIAAGLLVILTAGWLIAGSMQRVPEPFGLAANGALVYVSDGDIMARDTLTGESRVLVAGPGDDFAAGYTRDGRHVMFLRRTAGEAGTPSERLQLFLADADGSDAHALTTDLVAPDWFDLAPDDRTAVVHTGPAAHERLELVDLTTVAASRPIDLGRPLAATFPNFLAPTGEDVVFRGNEGGKTGIYAVHTDGTGLRALTRTDGKGDEFQFPQPSPDGRYLTYTSWDPVAQQLQVHLLDLAGGTDVVLDPAVGWHEGYATFSPDGGRLLLSGYQDSQHEILVAPLDGSAPALRMGRVYPGDHDVVGIFSPDGRWLVVQDNTAREARLVDASTGGLGEVLDWAGEGVTGWQRLAP